MTPHYTEILGGNLEELDALDSQAHGALSISDGVPDIADGFMSSSDATGLGISLN